MYLVKNQLLAFFRWFFETINIITEKRRIEIDEMGKLCDIYLWMG